MDLDIALSLQRPQMKMGRIQGLEPEVLAKLSYGRWKPMICIEIYKKLQYPLLLAG
jgi:hypothetical protein